MSVAFFARESLFLTADILLCFSDALEVVGTSLVGMGENSDEVETSDKLEFSKMLLSFLTGILAKWDLLIEIFLRGTSGEGDRDLLTGVLGMDMISRSLSSLIIEFLCKLFFKGALLVFGELGGRGILFISANVGL